MTRWIIGALVVAVAAGVLWLTGSQGRPVDVAVATRGEIHAYVDERGKTRLAEVFRITTPEAGRVRRITLTAGTPVQEGQVVAHMAPADLETVIAESEARVKALDAKIVVNENNALEYSAMEGVQNMLTAMRRVVEAATQQTKSSQAASAYAAQRLQRTTKLVATNAIPLEEHEKAEVDKIDREVDRDKDQLNLRAMQAIQAAMQIWPREIEEWITRKKLEGDVLRHEKEEAEALLEKAKRDLQRGTLRSPVDGVVLQRFISNERALPAGEVLLTIGRLEDLEIEVDVLSEDAVAIHEGNLAEVRGPAVGPTPAQAVVQRIHPAGFTKLSSLGVEQQRVTVVLRFADGELRRLRVEGRQLGTEYRVRVRIFTAAAQDAVTVPRNAVFKGGDGRYQAFVVRDGRGRLVDVKLGVTNDERAQILSGVEADQQIILAPEYDLTDGARVDARVLEVY